MYGPRPIRFLRTMVCRLFKIPGFSSRQFVKCLVPTPFFRSRLRHQNFNRAPRQYRQLCRLKNWLKLFKNRQLELVEQWDWSLSLIYQCAKCLIHSTLCIKHFSRSVGAVDQSTNLEGCVTETRSSSQLELLISLFLEIINSLLLLHLFSKK